MNIFNVQGSNKMVELTINNQTFNLSVQEAKALKYCLFGAIGQAGIPKKEKNYQEPPMGR